MILSGFPFYITGTTVDSDLIELMNGFRAFFVDNPKWLQFLNELYPSDYQYKDYENLILNSFLCALGQRLDLEEYEKSVEIVSAKLNSIDIIRTYKGHDLGTVFLEIKHSILNGEIPDKNKIAILSEAVLPGNEDWEMNVYYLFKFFGIDVELVDEYFGAISSLEEPFNLRECFHSIGVYGIRIIVSDIIKNNELDVHAIRHLRVYAQSYGLAISLANDLPMNSENDNSLKFIVALMKAAYIGGTIDREMEFYFKGASEGMRTISTSVSVRATHEPKKIYYKMAIEEATKRWDAGSKLFHNQMANELLKEDNSGLLTITRLRKELRPVAERYDLVWGAKRKLPKEKKG